MRRKLDEPQGRGDFFKSLGTLVASFMAERIEEAVTASGPKLLRPPGALDELAFLTACTRCDRCIRACPKEAILKAPPGSGLSVGTPYIHPRSMPCFLCSDLPCIPACPEGALAWPRRRVGSEEIEGLKAVKMGTAQIDESRCITFPREGRAAEACQVCVDRCPFPGEAIALKVRGERGLPHPRVQDERCTGCGLCVFACPASAIVISPRS